MGALCCTLQTKVGNSTDEFITTGVGKSQPDEPKVSLNSFSRSDLEVRLGEHNIWEPDETEQHIMSSKFARHPEYNPRTQDSDIMLIKLSRPATLNSFERPAALPSKCAAEGTMCQISGWGSLRPSDEGCEEMHGVGALL